MLRIEPDLHQKLTDMAKAQSLSLNNTCLKLLKLGLSIQEQRPVSIPNQEAVIKKLKKKFENKLLGVILFGSFARGEQTEVSDIDILIVLDKCVPIVRELYRWWDENIVISSDHEVNPHFVNFPDPGLSVSGIWLEVAQDGIILFDLANKIKNILQKLQRLIEKGDVRRYVSNGHAYWVWR